MKNPIQAAAVRYGVIAGIMWTVLTFGAWAMGVSTLAGFSMVGSFVPIIMGLFIYGGIELKKSQGGFLTFKTALQFAFLAYVVYELINAVVTYLLYNVIDPSLTAQLLETTLAKMESLMEKSGVPAGDIEKAMEKATAEEPKTNFKNIFLGFGFSLIWSFVKSLLIAAIIRKEPQPNFDQL
jgi:hypothetical protein